MVREEIEAYNKLISEVFNVIGGIEADDSLKKQFSNIIDSRRTYFAIKTCEDLIKTLDEKDEISEKDVSLLKCIIAQINNSKGPNENIKKSYELVTCYEKLHKSEVDAVLCCYICKAPNPRSILVEEPASAKPTKEVPEDTDLFDDLWDAIGEIEMDLAGSTWLKLGRMLKVKEGYLEELKFSTQPHSERVTDMFKQWIQNQGENASIGELIRALDHKRVARKDLVLKLKKKFPDHNA